MKTLYLGKKLHMVMIFLVLIGGLNWGAIGSFNIDLVKILDKYINYPVSKYVYIIVGICAVYLLLDRNVYLPFLGDAVYPCGSLNENVPKGYTNELVVNVPPNTKVVYWASEPSNEELKNLPNPWQAYKNYSNSGVVMSDKNGKTILKFKKPQPYETPMGKKLEPHVHYRYCLNNGMLSEVETIYL